MKTKCVMEVIPILEELLHVGVPFFIKTAEKDEKGKIVRLYIEVEDSYRPEGFENSRIHSYKERVWEHLPLFEYRCFIHGKIPMYQKKDTGELKLLKVEFCRQHSRFTLLFEARVMELMKIHHCFQKVAKTLNIYPQRVEHIYHHYTKEYENNPCMYNCKKIGYDETSTKKGHNYITTFVDMETHEILAVEDGKSGEAVELFAKRHPAPQEVEQVSIDMSPAFIGAAEKNFPNAKITFDKWHVIKLLYKHLEDSKNVSAGIHDSLMLGMSQISSFFKHKHIDLAKSHLLFMADFAQDKAGDNPFSKCIYRHFDGIIQYFSSGLTNGVLEGINSTIQTIKKVARGFRSLLNFKKMIRFVFSSQSILQPLS